MELNQCTFAIQFKEQYTCTHQYHGFIRCLSQMIGLQLREIHALSWDIILATVLHVQWHHYFNLFYEGSKGRLCRLR